MSVSLSPVTMVHCRVVPTSNTAPTPSNSCTPTTTYSTAIAISSEGTNYIRYKSTDTAGNVETVGSSIVKVDKAAPTTSDDYANNDVWVASSQSITLTPADATSGVASTKYCTDSSNACDPTTGTSYTTAVTISTEGITYYRYESTDNAGNVQTTISRTVKIDKTNPVVSAGSDQTEGSSFTQVAAASDVASGIASYQWSKQSGTGSVAFGSATSASTTITPDNRRHVRHPRHG